VIYGLLAALGWGTTDFLGAVSGRRMGSLPALGVSQAAGTSIAVVLFIVHGGGFSPLAGLLGFVVANGLIAMAAYALHYRALELGPVAVVSPIGAGYAVVGFSLAVLLLGEHPGGTAIVGGLITIAGVVLVSTNLPLLRAGLHEKPPGLWWAFGSSIGFGVAGLLLGVIARDSGDWVVTVLATRLALIVALTPLLLARRRRFHRLADAGAKAYATAAVAGLFDLMGVAAYSAGATHGYLSVVLAASAIFPMVAVALSVAFLHERLVLNQYVGVLAVVGGLLLLALTPGT
jgi:drug/metabolite transporter (DMT)-like permease